MWAKAAKGLSTESFKSLESAAALGRACYGDWWGTGELYAGPGNSNICFCVVFGQYCREFISGWGAWRWAMPPPGAEVSLVPPSFWGS